MPSAKHWRFPLHPGMDAGRYQEKVPAELDVIYASSSIRSGFSMHSLTRTRKLTASRPSMMRWS